MATVATKSSDWGVLKFERDRWTGQVFISQYGDAGVATHIRRPVIAYDHDAKKWVPHIESRIMRIRTIATVTWWILFAAAVVWLIVAFKRSLLDKGGRVEHQLS